MILHSYSENEFLICRLFEFWNLNLLSVSSDHRFRRWRLWEDVLVGPFLVNKTNGLHTHFFWTEKYGLVIGFHFGIVVAIPLLVDESFDLDGARIGLEAGDLWSEATLRDSWVPWFQLQRCWHLPPVDGVNIYIVSVLIGVVLVAVDCKVFVTARNTILHIVLLLHCALLVHSIN